MLIAVLRQFIPLLLLLPTGGQLGGRVISLGVIYSDRPVQPPLFRDQISNFIDLFRPNPNRTRHRITSFV